MWPLENFKLHMWLPLCFYWMHWSRRLTIYCTMWSLFCSHIWILLCREDRKTFSFSIDGVQFRLFGSTLTLLKVCSCLCSCWPRLLSTAVGRAGRGRDLQAAVGAGLGVQPWLLTSTPMLVGNILKLAYGKKIFNYFIYLPIFVWCEGLNPVPHAC